MKIIMDSYFNSVADVVFKAKKDKKKFMYHWNIYSMSILFPLIVMIIWSIYDIRTGVDYNVKDDIISIGFLIACVINTYIGITIGRKVLGKEIVHELIGESKGQKLDS